MPKKNKKLRPLSLPVPRLVLYQKNMKNTDKVLRGLFVSILGVACFVYYIGMPLYLSKLEEAMELGAASENAAVISWLNHLRENGKDLTGPIEFQVCNAMDKFTEEKEKYKSHLFYGCLLYTSPSPRD